MIRHAFTSPLVLLTLWSLGAPGRALAQPSGDQTAAAITLGRRLAFSSTVMGGKQSVMVYTPPDYDRSDARYPVLYLLDAESNYYFTAGIARLLATYDLAPAMVVVGIVSSNRNRDFVPTAPIEPVSFAASPGADTFLTYIEREVCPLVERTYRTEPYRILVGHSLGGLFAVHALIARPALFNAYVSISPTLWWNGWEYVRLVERSVEGRRSFKKYLFLSIADEEHDVSWRRLKEMETSLNAHAPKDFRLDFRYYGDENHATTVIESTLQALKLLYAKWPLPASPGCTKTGILN
jgi:predicted alpha/beta superfamily hydrolase